MPHAALWGVLAGLLRFVPYIGAVLVVIILNAYDHAGYIARLRTDPAGVDWIVRFEELDTTLDAPRDGGLVVLRRHRADHARLLGRIGVEQRKLAAAGLTQAEGAARIGGYASDVSKVESGERRVGVVELCHATHPGRLSFVTQPTYDDGVRKASLNAMSSHLGIEFTEFGEDFLRGTMPVEARTRQPMGYLHGGASVVLATDSTDIGASGANGSNAACT